MACRFVAYIVLASLLLCVQQAQAWQVITCQLPKNKGLRKHWTTPVYQPVLDPATIPAGSPQYKAIVAAIEAMNQNPSRFRFKLNGMDNQDGVAAGNGESEIWFQDLGTSYERVSAIELSDADYSKTCTATESDIIINTRYHLDRPPKGTNKILPTDDKQQLFEYGGSFSPLQSIVMHELGHSAGLQHEGGVLNLMGGDYLLIANANQVSFYIGEDSTNGLLALYGKDPVARADLSVSHWRYGTKISGGGGSFFSIHHRTGLFTADNQVLPLECPYKKPDVDGTLISNCPEPVYIVKPGQAINMELTYENASSTQAIPARVQYYLSNDSTINADDHLLMATTLVFKQDGQPTSFNTRLEIPKYVQDGQHYWLGSRVDADNTIPESFEDNNATYIGVLVKVP